MKFDYPDITTTEYNNMRFYEVGDGKFYPSITTILGKTISKEKEESLNSWRKSLGMALADKKTKEARDNGTAVHLLAERYLKKIPLNEKEFTLENINSFNGLKLKLNKIKRILAQEAALYSDMLQVAGRVDLIGEYNGKLSIIDFKTSTSLKDESRIEDYKLQLCAYAAMHNEMFGTDIQTGIILMTSGGGFPQEFTVDLTKYVSALCARVETFYSKFLK